MTTETTTKQDLVKWLQDLAKEKDRARIAALRRGLLLEPNQFFELYRVVPAQYLEGVSRREVQHRLMVAILFATHPKSFSEEQLERRPRNLGESLRLLAAAQAGGAIDPELGLPEPLKRRLDALLAAHPDDLFHHLRQVVRLLKSREIPVDWRQLLRDLRNWDREDHMVQWRWSQSFYVGERDASDS